MNNIRFNENVKLIKNFMDRLWAILPAGWGPEYKEDRERDSIELWLRNYNDKTYAKRYLTHVSYRSPEEIMFDITTWMTKYIVETYSSKYIAEKYDDKKKPKITKVIFNDPATIVFWLDGTKTVVKCDDKERYDPEKGLAMAISKKALGNQGNYYNEFKRWMPDKLHVAPTIHARPDSVLYDSIMSSSLTELSSLSTFGEFEKWINESIKRRFQND